MAKKPFKFNELSLYRCEVCGRFIKKNLVERKKTQFKFLCYKHYREQQLAKSKKK